MALLRPSGVNAAGGKWRSFPKKRTDGEKEDRYWRAAGATVRGKKDVK